jgi:hypothetical protein
VLTVLTILALLIQVRKSKRVSRELRNLQVVNTKAMSNGLSNGQINGSLGLAAGDEEVRRSGRARRASTKVDYAEWTDR